MSISASTIERDATGRFVPGQSGNPAGKAPGTRNRATLLRALMAEDEEQVIGRLVIDKAKAGDAVAARFVIGHLYPRPRARTVALELAGGLPAKNVVAAHDAVLTAMFAGEIAPDEAEAMTRVLDARMRALKAWREEAHMAKWERGFPATPPPKAPVVRDEPKSEPSEPSPPGRGQGEGARRPTERADSSRNPHPDPLPGGEGEGTGEGIAPTDSPPRSPAFRLHRAGAAGDDAAVRALDHALLEGLTTRAHGQAKTPP